MNSRAILSGLWGLGSALLLACATARGASTGAAPAAPEELVFRIGLPRVAFTHLNETDASTAYSRMVATIGRQRGYSLRTEVLIYDDPADFVAAMRAGRLHLIVLSAWDYIHLGIGDVADLEFVVVSQGREQHRLLLLTRQGGIESVAALRGRRITVLRHPGSWTAERWLQGLLTAQGLGPLAEFCGSIERTGKPSAALLPVFFGRADACVADEAAFTVAAEMNPQIGRQLRVLARSEPLLDTVMCLGRGGWPTPDAREDTRRAMLEQHLTPEGQQILAMFKVDRVVPLADGQLETVRALYEAGAGVHPVAAVAEAAP